MLDPNEKTIPSQNKWLILAVVLLGPFMATLDSSIVNVALPNMASRLSVSISDIQWTVTSYLIVISSSILIFGRMADIKGKNLIFKNGFLIFSIGSLLCGLSNSLKFLVLSRIIQAIGAAMIMACNQGIIAATFPPNERGRALGLSGTTVALGTMIGPPLGGIMVGLFNWESIFLINVPIGILAYFLSLRILPSEKEIATSEKFDGYGALVFALAIITLFWAMLNAENLGFTNISIVSSFLISIFSFIIFYRIEMKVTHPMLDFSLFRNKLFTISIICGFISFMVIFCTNIIHPFYLQSALSIPPEKAGLLMIVYPITLSIIAPLSGYLSDKIGSRLLTLIGLIVTALSLLAMAFLNVNSTYTDIIIRASLLGLGNGLFQSPNNSLVMSSVPKNKFGIAGSINALVRNLGMVFGIAFSMTLLYNRMSAKVGYKVLNFIPSRVDAFIYAMKFVYITSSLICVIGILLTLTRLVNRKGR